MSTRWAHNQITRALARYPLISRVFELSAERKLPVYLVGGTVRDLLIGRETHDLDFAVQGSGLSLARYLADQLGGYFVALDRTRRTGRVLLPHQTSLAPLADKSHPASLPQYLDIASLRGNDLLADLQGRDFTLNAMAIAPTENGSFEVHDPLDGHDDLRKNILRMASLSSFEDDPVRALRAVRMQHQFDCRIEPRTRARLTEAASLLHRVSAERIRDEWFKILDLTDAATAIDEMAQLGLLHQVAPTVARAEHLGHALDTLRATERLWATFDTTNRTHSGAELPFPQNLHALGPHIRQRYTTQICDERSYLALLKCAALLHPVDAKSASLAEQWRLSKRETELLRIAVHHYADVQALVQESGTTRRTIYRFFAQNGEHGIDAALLFLAHTLAAWELDPTRGDWPHLTETVAQLLKAWFEHRETQIHPTPLLSGQDVMRALGQSPGPQIGALLQELAEEQAAGEILNRQQALDHLQHWRASKNRSEK